MADTDTPCLFTLIVATYGRADKLDRLLASLAAQSFRDFEVVVVDQNPPGMLDPILAPYEGSLALRHLRSEKGLSRARNVGLAAAASPLVAFPDDDCWYEPGCLAAVSRVFARRVDLSIVSARTTDADGLPSVSPFVAEEADVTRRNYLECGNSNGLFLRRAVFGTIGGFDERLGVGAQTPFQSGEEADIILRALEAGFSMRAMPQLRVFHDQVESDPAATVKRSGAYGAGFGALMRKHRFGHAYLGYRVLRSSARLAVAALRSPAFVAERWAWIRGMVRGYALWSRLERAGA